MSKKTIRMLEKHGLAACRRAHQLLCLRHGPAGISRRLGFHWKTGMKLALAGREIAKLESGCI